MKTKIIILITIIINLLTFSQSLTQSEKQIIIGNLDSIQYAVREKAILDIISYNISESLPKLEQNIFKQEQGIAGLYLDALFRFNSSLAINYAHRFIDTIDNLKRMSESYGQPGSWEIRRMKYDAASLLFKVDDLLRADIILGWFDYNSPSIVPNMPKQLSQILNNIPQYEIIAKNELLRIANLSEEEDYSSSAVKYLSEYYNSSIIPELLNIYANNNYGMTRLKILKYLDQFNYSDYENFLKQNFLSDTSNADIILEQLLLKYPNPANYNFITSNLEYALTPTFKDYFSLWIEDSYEPTPPKEFSSIMQYMDYTALLCDTLVNYTWLGNLAFSNELKNILTTAKTNLQNGDSLSCRVQVKAFQDLVDNVYKDSLNTDPRFVTIEGWKFLYWNAQYILDRLPEPPANPNLVVNLKSSLGNQIPASNVMYYEGSWKDAVNNGDGTYTVLTTRPTVSIRVFYEYASQQVDNVTAQNNTYTFTTVNAAVQLKNSLGNFIDVGTVQYYAGAWRTFGATSNGVAYKELLPVNFSFRMTYEYGSIDKQQNLSSDPTVVFQTVNAAVQLKNSLSNLIDAGTVQYYAGAWRSFGTTSNGVAYKELFPINYSFRMTYEYVSKDKQQNLSTNPVVDFNTVLCSVKVSKTSDNQPINNADVKYYSGAWRNLGTTNADGISTKEILPANLSFRATSGTVSLDKQQDISVNSLVEIILNIP